MDGKMEEELAAFLESKRDSFEGTPGFEDRVMAAVHNAAAPARLEAGTSLREAVRNGWAARRNDWRDSLLDLLRTPGRWAYWAPAGLALAIAVFFAVRPVQEAAGSAFEGAPGGIRIKGEAFGFAVLVQVGDTGYRKVEGEADLRAGDRIQALYWLADSAYVELLSLDARGKAECYSCGQPAGRYRPAAGQPLPFGLELDPAPGPELFVLAASPERKHADHLRQALQGAWRDGGKDLGKAAGKLHRLQGETMYRTLLVRKGERS